MHRWQDVPIDLVLAIEYLDYAKEARPRAGIERMPASRRALHSISCLLADMASIVNPAAGRATAISSSEELDVCILGLRQEVSRSVGQRGCLRGHSGDLGCLGRGEVHPAGCFVRRIYSSVRRRTQNTTASPQPQSLSHSTFAQGTPQSRTRDLTFLPLPPLQSTVELTLLLCKSLRALLLAMLGQRDAAAEILDTIHPLVDLPSGGNPSVIRALPLSWDALLIAASLAFILGQGPTYQRLRASVELVTRVPDDARWTFCLPEPGSDPRAYVTHECQSSSNICAIMCEIANRTAFGGRPFYADEQQQQEQPPPTPPQQLPQQQFLHEPSPTMPAVVLSSPHHQLLLDPEGSTAAAGQQSRQHRYGFDYEGKVMRRTPSDLHGSFPPAVNGGGAADTAMSFFDGGFGGFGGAGAAELDAATAAVPDDPGAAGAFIDAAAYKRRRMMVGVDDGGSSDPSGHDNDFVLSSGGHQPALLAKTHPVYGGAGSAGHTDQNDQNYGTTAFNLRELGQAGGGGETAGGKQEASGDDIVGADVGGEDGDAVCGSLGLTRGFHNMSLSRLSGPLGSLQQDPGGQLGRVPSDGILDLNSSLGSFNMDLMGMDGSVGGGVKSEERLGSFSSMPQVAASDCDTGGANNLSGIMFPASSSSSSSSDSGGGSGNGSGNKRPLGGGGTSACSSSKPLRLSSFSTYATSLCRSPSSSMLLPLGRGRDDGSIGQCGSDLGHDIVGSADDFMDEEGNDDICGNILSVDAILRDTGRGLKDDGGDADGGGGGDEALPPPPGGGGGDPMQASDSSGGGGGGGDDARLSLDDQQQITATKALADFYEAGALAPLSAQPSLKMEASC